MESQNRREDPEVGEGLVSAAYTSVLPWIFTECMCVCVRAHVNQAQVKVDVGCLKEDIRKLKSLIVEPPEELKNQMEKMRESVKSIRSSIVSWTL